jgi:hypothetical protein
MRKFLENSNRISNIAVGIYGFFDTDTPCDLTSFKTRVGILILISTERVKLCIVLLHGSVDTMSFYETFGAPPPPTALIHSLFIQSAAFPYDRSITSSKASSPHSAI